MKRLLFFLTVLLACLDIQAQELIVKSMMNTNDLSASQHRSKDNNGDFCALVKVQLAVSGAEFEGNVIKPVEQKGGEYWVYMSKGSRELRIKHPNYVPLHINFADYGINKGVQSLVTYDLTLLLPKGGNTQNQKQRLIINYTPDDAIVLIDSKLYKGNGHIEAELPVGNHDYIIAANGYETVEATIKLTVNAPRTITENLEKTSTIISSKDSFEISPIYVAKYAFECIKERDERGFFSCLVEFDDELQHVLGSVDIIHEAQNMLKQVLKEGLSGLSIDYNMYSDFLMRTDQIVASGETIRIKEKEYKFVIFEARFIKINGETLSSDLRFILNSNGKWKMGIPLGRQRG